MSAAVHCGILGCMALLSIVQTVSTVRVQKRERQLREFLKRVLKKTSASGQSWKIVGTERGVYKGGEILKEGARKCRENSWGLQQDTQVEGRYQKGPSGSGFESHMVKKAQIALDGEDTVTIETETLSRRRKALMRVKGAPWGCDDVFPDGWFPIENHALGDLMNVDIYATGLDMFSIDALCDQGSQGVTEAPKEVIGAEKVRCVRVEINPSYVRSQDSKIYKADALVSTAGCKGFADSLYKNVEAWTEYLISDREEILIGVRSQVRSFSISPKSRKWECDVEATRDFALVMESVRADLPDPLFESQASVLS